MLRLRVRSGQTRDEAAVVVRCRLSVILKIKE